jgi:hypothetical protein
LSSANLFPVLPLEGSGNQVGEETGGLLEGRDGEKIRRGFEGSNLGSLSTRLIRHARNRAISMPSSQVIDFLNYHFRKCRFGVPLRAADGKTYRFLLGSVLILSRFTGRFQPLASPVIFDHGTRFSRHPPLLGFVDLDIVDLERASAGYVELQTRLDVSGFGHHFGAARRRQIALCLNY